MKDCLENIIGLSQKDCPCIDDNIPANAAESVSGLFLDELEGLSLKDLTKVVNCETGELWDLLQRALELGKEMFCNELYMALMEDKKTIFTSAQYVIGKKKGRETISSDANKIGLRIQVANVKDGCIDLSQIGFLFNGSFNLDYEIYSDEQDAPLYSFTGVNITANTPSFHEPNVSLPMTQEDGTPIEYYIVYDNPAPIQPINNNIGCCGTKTSFCVDNPCFHINRDTAYGWTRHLAVASIDGDLDDWNTTSNCGGGMILKLRLCCNPDEVICDNVCAKGRMMQVMATAIQYAAGYKLYSLIYGKTGGINKYTLLPDEKALGAINSSYKKEFMDRINFIAENIDTGASGCFTCDPKIIVKHRKI